MDRPDMIRCGRCGSDSKSHICIDVENTPLDTANKIIDALRHAGITSIKVWRYKEFIGEIKT